MTHNSAPKKPFLDGLPGSYTIDGDLREQLELPNILNIEVKLWSNYESVIDDYFENATYWEEGAKTLYSLLLLSLLKIVSCETASTPLRNYAKKTRNRYLHNTVKTHFEATYQTQEKQARLRREVAHAIVEGDITGAKLSKDGAKKLYNTKVDIFNDDFETDKEYIGSFFNSAESDGSSLSDEGDLFVEDTLASEIIGDDTAVNSEFLREFNEKFKLMDNDNKWKLSDNVYVEDQLHKFGMKCCYEHLCHSFIVDPDDNTYLHHNVFTYNQLQEIRNYRPITTPEIDDNTLNYLLKYEDIKDTKDLRKLLAVRDYYHNYDAKNDGIIDYIDRVLDSFLVLYEKNSFNKSNNERWYQNRIWVPLIDNLFETIENTVVIRGEASLEGSSSRKNFDRLPPSINKLDNKKMGRRQDLIIKSNQIELGVGEEKAENNGTDIIYQRGVKCPKSMKDAFMKSINDKKYDMDLLNKLNIVGITTFGLDIYTDFLDCPVHYTCRITRSKKFSVPQKIVEISRDLLPLLSALISVKIITTKNITLLSKANKCKSYLKSSLKRSLENEENYVLNKITCATTPCDNGRFRKQTKNN